MGSLDELSAALYPDGDTREIEHAFDQVKDKLQRGLGLTDAQTLELKTKHAGLLRGVIRGPDARDVYAEIAHGLARPLVSDADADAQARAEDARVETLRTLRNEFGWETDAVLERARRMVKQQPGLAALLEESGTVNSTRVWMAICRKARVLMNRDK